MFWVLNLSTVFPLARAGLLCGRSLVRFRRADGLRRVLRLRFGYLGIVRDRVGKRFPNVKVNPCEIGSVHLIYPRAHFCFTRERHTNEGEMGDIQGCETRRGL